MTEKLSRILRAAIESRVFICAVVTAACGAPMSIAQTSSTYDYDALGRVTSVMQGNGGYTSYGYDAAGNRVSKSVFQADKNMQSWEAESLHHDSGFADGDGWAANIHTPPSFMVFGPYTRDIEPGERVAAWRMMVDNNTADDAHIIDVDVYDATAGQVLASRAITRKQFASTWTYQHFFLPFKLAPERRRHEIELRTYYRYGAHVRVDRTGVLTSVLTGADLGNGWTHAWEAEHLQHETGFADGDGWAANIYSPSMRLLSYGPYVALSTGSRKAVWRLMVDNVDADKRSMVRLDVYDATAGEVLTETTLFRSAWSAPWTYEYFGLPFEVSPERAGHLFEFRTYYYDSAHVRLDKVGLKP